ncbi:hypothetical protein BgiBS90_030203 [Biomphalaria glabrata]|nr:hypothetical protein BgiBS90_030203 [Biomphalaria glabrata]
MKLNFSTNINRNSLASLPWLGEIFNLPSLWYYTLFQHPSYLNTYQAYGTTLSSSIRVISVLTKLMVLHSLPASELSQYLPSLWYYTLFQHPSYLNTYQAYGTTLSSSIRVISILTKLMVLHSLPASELSQYLPSLWYYTLFQHPSYLNTYQAYGTTLSSSIRVISVLTKLMVLHSLPASELSQYLPSLWYYTLFQHLSYLNTYQAYGITLSSSIRVISILTKLMVLHSLPASELSQYLPSLWYYTLFQHPSYVNTITRHFVNYSTVQIMGKEDLQ